MRAVVLASAAWLAAGCGGRTFTLEYPWALAITLTAVVVVALWRMRRRSGRAALAFSRVDAVEGLPWSLRTVASRVPFVLRMLALFVLAVAVARPQLEEFDQRAVEGIDIFLVLDMSGSMYAVDMHALEIQRFQAENRSDPPNRFDNAIATLQRFVDGRSRDRIGMVVFARQAYLQFPLTLDYATIQTLLDRLELDAIDSTATAIGNALGLGVRGLMSSEARSRAIILITDGRQQGGNISPAQAAQIATEEGIRIYPILVGREGPAMAPSNMRNRDGTRRFVQQDYPVDAALLERLAQDTGGQFYRAEAPEALETGLNAILDDLETTSMTDVASVLEIELFSRFVALALLLLGLEALLAWVFARRFP